MSHTFPLAHQANAWLEENYVAYYIGDILHAVTWRGQALFCEI